MKVTYKHRGGNAPSKKKVRVNGPEAGEEGEFEVEDGYDNVDEFTDTFEEIYEEWLTKIIWIKKKDQKTKLSRKKTHL